MSLPRDDVVPPRRRRRAAAAGILLVALVAFASLRLDHPVGPVPNLVTARHPVNDASDVVCRAHPLSREDGTPVTDTTDLRLNTNTYLAARLCQPTRVRLTADGSAVDGIGARLIISIGVTDLYDSALTAPQQVDVTATTPGWLIISFANDLYRPPADRNLRLTNVTLTPLQPATTEGDDS